MSASTDEACSSDDELEPSKLGTKEHWNTAYERELKNFKDTGDVGDVWFGEDSVRRVVNWIAKCQKLARDAYILDVGCGNGITLIELHKVGFSNLFGVDYVAAATELAKNIAEEQERNIVYEVGDILETPLETKCLQCRYGVCIDKGTYDAISLCPEEPSQKRAKYVTNVASLLLDGGLLVMTSCNWTKEELLDHFDKDFTLFEDIPTPTFCFGGVVGRRETALVLQRKPYT